MLTSIYNTDDVHYREFIIDFVLRYYKEACFTQTEKDLLKGTHYFHHVMHENGMDFINPDTSKNGCCRGIPERRYLADAFGEPCVSDQAVLLEKSYRLREIDQSWVELRESWRCLGRVNFRFRSPKMEHAFVIHCVERVLREHGDLVFVNTCPVCKRLKRTPKAKLCMWCCSSGKLPRWKKSWITTDTDRMPVSSDDFLESGPIKEVICPYD